MGPGGERRATGDREGDDVWIADPGGGEGGGNGSTEGTGAGATTVTETGTAASIAAGNLGARNIAASAAACSTPATPNTVGHCIAASYAATEAPSRKPHAFHLLTLGGRLPYVQWIVVSGGSGAAREGKRHGERPGGCEPGFGTGKGDVMGTRLYVGNLPYTTDEQALRLFFGDGTEGRQVTQVKIVIDRETGRPRGFAFVELSEAMHARVAIEALNGQSFGGRTIVVNEAREPQRGVGGGGAERSGAGERAGGRSRSGGSRWSGPGE